MDTSSITGAAFDDVVEAIHDSPGFRPLFRGVFVAVAGDAGAAIFEDGVIRELIHRVLCRNRSRVSGVFKAQAADLRSCKSPIR